MTAVLFEDESRDNLLPFTFTRPVSHIRAGILTIREKWEQRLGLTCTVEVPDYLRVRFGQPEASPDLYLNSSVLPDATLADAVRQLKPGQRLTTDGNVLAARTDGKAVPHPFEGFKEISFPGHVLVLHNAWDIFVLNEAAMVADFELLTAGKKSAALSSTNHVLQADRIFLEPGARVEHAFLNATQGPIYIARDAEVMEGAMIRGPFVLGEKAVVKMGAKIYGATTIGPSCRVGGEINNSVLFGNSNKAHDGFLGNSVIGEWCNLGADSNNSNLKNNYSTVRMWNYKEENYVSTGLQFCGLMMGDHSKCSINTMFNTGTVVGVSANIFGNGFPPKMIPSFSWGGSEGFTSYRLPDAMDVAQRVYERRNMLFDAADQAIFKHLFQESTRTRAW